MTIPVLFADFQCWRQREDTSTIDEKIYRAQLCSGHLDHLVHLDFVRDVHLERDPDATGARDFLGHLLSTPHVDVGHSHRCSFHGEANRDGAPDTASSAGHDGGLILEFVAGHASRT